MAPPTATPARGLAARLLAAAALLLPLASAYAPLPDDVLRGIPSGDPDFDVEKGSLLAPILTPRIPGTDGSLAAQNHFLSFFEENLPEWSVDIHNSTSKTPATGDEDVPFANLIFRRDPPWAAGGDVSRLTLVAHYDTLREPEGFVGAIDSAAPCAMLMHVARSIEDALAKKWAAMVASGEGGAGLEEEKGVQIVLLDGEEAFVSWSATDSLYGARALAKEWETSFYPAASTFKTPLQSISLFVLLDLLGAKKPSVTVPSYFLTTHWAYQGMARVEERMRSMGLLQSKPPAETPRFLPDADKPTEKFGRGYIQDDHIPFMARGVDILHLIPTPFPDQWHNSKGVPDDADNLDLAAVDDWAKIVTAFTAEWMELGEYLPKKEAEKGTEKETGKGAAKRATTSKTEL